MKRLVVSIVLVVFAAFQVNAQTKSPLEGSWQQCSAQDVNGKMEIVPLPRVKTLTSDGKFQNLVFRMEGNGSFVSTHGSYRIVSDTTYVESIEESLDVPQLKRKDSFLKFRIQDKNWLFVSYRLPGASRDATELWKRIEMK